MSTVWTGPEEFRPLLVPIDAVRQHPRNPRRGDVGMVADSLERYGQTRPLVTWRSPTGDLLIIAGNHRWQAAHLLGWTHVAVISDPAMTEQEAIAFLLRDNRTGDLAEYDDQALIDLLGRIYGESGSLDGTGFTADDLDEMVDAANRQDAVPPQRDPVTGKQLKQIVLSYGKADWDEYEHLIVSLLNRYGVDTPSEVVAIAVEREWKEAWGE